MGGPRLMKRLAAALTLGAAAAVQAQFGYDPVMVNNWANIYLNGEINRITIQSATPGQGGRTVTRPRNPPASAISTWPIEQRLEITALEALRPGLHRHWRQEGAQAAQRWYVASARRIGAEMGALVPDYRRRVARDGRGRADQWFLAQARQAGARLNAD